MIMRARLRYPLEYRTATTAGDRVKLTRDDCGTLAASSCSRTIAVMRSMRASIRVRTISGVGPLAWTIRKGSA